MRVNVYTEELTFDVKVVEAEYVSSRSGQPMTNFGVRLFLKSHPDLHFLPKDDDRSAVTLWLGDNEKHAHTLRDLLAHVLEELHETARR